MRDDFDIITVGGGLGGAALAKVMAEQGARVLVLEREHRFKDRIRGEWVSPWGGAELQRLGLYDALLENCAVPQRFLDRWVLHSETLLARLLTKFRRLPSIIPRCRRWS
jgi:flavin-dependent dehydrogenase